MSLGKLFENVSTSEFLRDIYIGRCMISRVKIMNNVLNRITLGTFIPGRLGTSLAVCRDKIFAGKIVNMAVLREVSSS